MVNSILIVCDRSPIGKNSAAEAIRLGSGFVALGEELDCELIFMGDAVYLFNKHADPTAVGMDPVTETLEMADLSDLPVRIVKEDLDKAGLSEEDLIEYDNMELITKEELAEMMNNSTACFRI